MHAGDGCIPKPSIIKPTSLEFLILVDLCRERLDHVPDFDKIYGGWWTTIVRLSCLSATTHSRALGRVLCCRVLWLTAGCLLQTPPCINKCIQAHSALLAHVADSSFLGLTLKSIRQIFVVCRWRRRGTRWRWRAPSACWRPWRESTSGTTRMPGTMWRTATDHGTAASRGGAMCGTGAIDRSRMLAVTRGKRLLSHVAGE